MLFFRSIDIVRLVFTAKNLGTSLEDGTLSP